MAIVTITLYATIVQDGIVQSDSTLVTLEIDDANDDGFIDRDEWANYTGSPHGQLAGETTPPALWAADHTGSVTTGTLYSPVAYEPGDDVTGLLDELEKSDYAPSVDDLNICYLAGTLIATPDGQRPVESLRPNDLVLTRDHGPQPVKWCSLSHVTPQSIDLAPNRRPLRIKAGSLGNGLPWRDVDVSAQHRVLVTDASGGEYLIAACQLMKAGHPGIGLSPVRQGFDLVHIALARHEILLAEGAAMESFFTGPMAVRALSTVQRLGLCIAFPDLAKGRNPMQPARPFIRHKEYLQIQALVGMNA